MVVKYSIETEADLLLSEILGRIQESNQLIHDAD